MVTAELFWFFGRIFLEGLGLGVVMRILFSVLVRVDFTIKGLIMTGILFGLINVGLKYYVISKMVIP